jgi:hypothetical protein
MNPKSGGRAVLELLAESADAVRYRAELFVPDATFTSEASVAVTDGAVSFAPWTPSEPPAWLLKYATTFLRSAWRERQKDIPWPSRINRWREERE